MARKPVFQPFVDATPEGVPDFASEVAQEVLEVVEAETKKEDEKPRRLRVSVPYGYPIQIQHQGIVVRPGLKVEVGDDPWVRNQIRSGVFKLED